MVNEYLRPQTIREALAAKAEREDSRYLAGGTYLLAGDYRQKPEMVIDISDIVPAGISIQEDRLVIGAGTVFEDILDSAVPASFGAAEAFLLRGAALSMANRNVRNRATAGGNIAGRKSAASLIPALLALDAELELAAAGADGAAESRRAALSAWLQKPEGIVMNIEIPRTAEGTVSAFLRYARTSCDLSILNAAVAFIKHDGKIEKLHIAAGGVAAEPLRLSALEAELEGRSLPDKASIEKLAAPLLAPRGDQRGSAEFKRLRAAALIADALTKAWSGSADPDPLGIDVPLSGIGRRA